MPRKSRIRSASEIYHIMMRGINRQTIFTAEEEYSRFIFTLGRYKKQCGFEIYAYCLMPNHLHILMKVGTEPLAQIMRRICGSYVYWYNKRHDRIGNLFQDRFRSEAVEDDNYFLTVLRYIHQNPVKAGLCENIEEYPWSSVREYIEPGIIVDRAFGLGFFEPDVKKNSSNLLKFCQQVMDDKCLDIDADEKHQVSDHAAESTILRVCKIESPAQLAQMNREIRDTYVRILKTEHQLSVRQIARVTGLNRGVVLNA
ncbi:MAG: transposase [Syntrophomonadaceae bacterium]